MVGPKKFILLNSRDAAGGVAALDANRRVETERAEAFPVGAVYLSIDATNPGTALGYGTWTEIAAGRCLTGYDSGDTDFDAAEKTGGAKTVAATGTVSAIAATADAAGRVGTSGATLAVNTHTHPAPTFNGTPSSVVQPFFVVHVWKRVS